MREKQKHYLFLYLQENWNSLSLYVLTFIIAKHSKETKTSFILLLIKYIEDISLNLLSSDAHFNISDIRKVYTPRQDWWLGGHTIVSSIFSELNADFM